MARRIDIELTSARPDGTWTWRAAGAKQPKGVLEGNLLYDGAAVGDVVRAEADFEIEGIFVTSVFPPKAKERKEPERLEIIGPPRDHQGVTSSLVPKSDRGRREGGRGPRREGGDRPRDGERGPRRDGGDRPRTGAGPRDGARGGGGARPGRPDGRERPARPPREAREERPAPPKPKRLTPLNVHRAAVLESLSPEQRPVAEHVLRGGIPAVRQAVDAQNAKLREAGEPEVKAEALLALAEELLPRLKTAEWRDRAEAAVKEVDEIALRDLRSVVSGADAAARDDETRLLASTLREGLERRIAKQREEWVKEITTCLDDGRLVRALRVSSRPPDPGTRFPAELSTRLVESANAALNPDVAPDRWATVLEAVAASPVRRQVKPVGLPAEPGEPLLQAAKQSAGLVPALAPLLGLDMPPPPPPAGRGARRPAPGRRPVPPPPARKPKAAPAGAPTGPAAAEETGGDARTTPAADAPAEATATGVEAPTAGDAAVATAPAAGAASTAADALTAEAAEPEVPAAEAAGDAVETAAPTAPAGDALTAEAAEPKASADVPAAEAAGDVGDAVDTAAPTAALTAPAGDALTAEAAEPEVSAEAAGDAVETAAPTTPADEAASATTTDALAADAAEQELPAAAEAPAAETAAPTAPATDATDATDEVATATPSIVEPAAPGDEAAETAESEAPAEAGGPAAGGPEQG